MDTGSSRLGSSAVAWRTVEVFRNRGVAQVAGSALASADLPFRIVADDAEGIGLPLGLRHGGAQLQVPTEHLEEAQALLGDNTVEGAGRDEDRPIDPTGLDMGVGMALKLVAAAIVAALVLAALVDALG